MRQLYKDKWKNYIKRFNLKSKDTNTIIYYPNDEKHMFYYENKSGSIWVRNYHDLFCYVNIPKIKENNILYEFKNKNPLRRK